MFQVTEVAQKEIADYFKDKEVKPIRVFLNEGGCGGPSMAMALDDIKDTDKVYKFGDFQYIIDQTFMEKAGPVTVDFKSMGFAISANIELSSGCGCCSSKGSCG